MKTVEEIKTHIHDVITERKGWLWFVAGLEENEDTFLVSDDFQEAASRYGVSEDLLRDIDEALGFVAEQLVEGLERDLADIWEKATK